MTLGEMANKLGEAVWHQRMADTFGPDPGLKEAMWERVLADEGVGAVKNLFGKSILAEMNAQGLAAVRMFLDITPGCTRQDLEKLLGGLEDVLRERAAK